MLSSKKKSSWWICFRPKKHLHPSSEMCCEQLQQKQSNTEVLRWPLMSIQQKDCKCQNKIFWCESFWASKVSGQLSTMGFVMLANPQPWCDIFISPKTIPTSIALAPKVRWWHAFCLITTHKKLASLFPPSSKWTSHLEGSSNWFISWPRQKPVPPATLAHLWGPLGNLQVGEG